MRYIVYYNGDLLELEGGEKNTVPPPPGKGIERKYTMKYSTYRKIASSAAKMWDIHRNNIVFLTFTIGSKLYDTKETNPAWKKFLNSMRKTYKLNSYIWVAERQKNGRIHYHMLADMPKWNMKGTNTLQKSYYNTMKNAGIYVHPTNSLRLPPKKSGGAVVKSRERAVKYLAKYISNSINDVFSSRNYAISRKLHTEPIEITYENFEELRSISRSYRKFEHLITYFIDSDDVRRMWNSLVSGNQIIKDINIERKFFAGSMKLKKSAQKREGEVIDYYRDMDDAIRTERKKSREYLEIMT